MIKCALSGKTTPNLVINRKNGMIYDLDILKEHLKISENCPLTGEIIKLEDFTRIKSSLENNIKENEKKPNGIDKVIEELELTFHKANSEVENLRVKNEVLKKELVFLENQNDEGIKYIAKLLKEKEEFQKKWENISSSSHHNK